MLLPLIWSLVVDDLLVSLSNKGIEVQGYADDIVINAREKFEETLCDIVETGLKETQKWCTTVGLRLNAKKTKILPFTKRRKLEGIRPIQLREELIDVKQEVKYLDSKLLWHKHMKTVAKKATCALLICRNLAGKSWGCRPAIDRCTP